ncbi:MAG: M48 family metallopeptidase, partial [Natronospirillum sp.]|uniref:M48 family metallopeptidase n=1 Tax=Natronospirillum sp. TaxID=2812955 RepID=UPI0025D0FD5D
MDFFTEQDRARRKTGRLVLLLILATAALIAVTTLVIAVAIYFMGLSQQPSTQAVNLDLSPEGVLSALSVELVAGVAAVVLSLVVLGSLFKHLQLNRGGRAVAEALGGRLISGNTDDPDEKRILNVVEEMSLASGMPVPPVYVLDDDSINAFAAGYRADDAVIGITRGSISNLTRPELQGVVAHEFSHILHGDMRLNMRLVSILHGILVIGLLGSTLLRSMRYRRFGGRGRQDNSAVAILSIGALLTAIGYAGVFFGNLIKSAVSRQREYLADASAVQFTREPQGIGGALVKIGAHSKGSRLEAAQANEFSHMFFGQGVKLGFNRMMATHPPVEDRIKRVMPGWDGRFRVTWPAADASAKEAQAAKEAGGAPDRAATAL